MTPVPPSGREQARRVICSPQERPDARNARLEALLADLGSRVQRGAGALEPLPRIPTGLPEIDRLLGGGAPRGRLCEISGPLSSGRTSLVLGLLASVTRSGECAAVVDRADALDPRSAEAAGVDLDRVLWVRPPDWREALRCTERLLETDGFPLVLLDMPSIQSQNASPKSAQRAEGERSQNARPASPPEEGAQRGEAERSQGGERSSTIWLRLARQSAGTGTALVLLSQQRLAGSCAEIALALQPARARFAGSPPLLEELETRAVLVRHREAPIYRAAWVRLKTSSAA